MTWSITMSTEQGVLFSKSIILIQNRNIKTEIQVCNILMCVSVHVRHNMSVVNEGNIGKYSMSIDFSQTLDLGFNYILQTVYI